MNDHIIWIIAVFGLVTLGGVFYRMQGGLGPFSPRAVGICHGRHFRGLARAQGWQFTYGSDGNSRSYRWLLVWHPGFQDRMTMLPSHALQRTPCAPVA